MPAEPSTRVATRGCRDSAQQRQPRPTMPSPTWRPVALGFSRRHAITSQDERGCLDRRYGDADRGADRIDGRNWGLRVFFFGAGGFRSNIAADGIRHGCRRTLPRCECAKPPIGGSWGANEAKCRLGAAPASGYRPRKSRRRIPSRPRLDARRQLTAIVASALKDTLPAAHRTPAPADELLGYYRKAEAATGVRWNYLAAINRSKPASPHRLREPRRSARPQAVPTVDVRRLRRRCAIVKVATAG